MLEVGKVYKHGSVELREEASLFIITERWAPDLFIGGRTYGGKIVEGSLRWAFDNNGNAIGYANNQGAKLNWKIVPRRDDEYEVMLIYPDTGLPGNWEKLDRGTPWTSRTKYLVRKKDDHASLQCMDHNKLLDFLDDFLD